MNTPLPMDSIEQEAERQIRIFIRDYLDEGEVRRNTPVNMLANEQFADVLHGALSAFRKSMLSKAPKTTVEQVVDVVLPFLRGERAWSKDILRSQLSKLLPSETDASRVHL